MFEVVRLADLDMIDWIGNTELPEDVGSFLIASLTSAWGSIFLHDHGPFREFHTRDLRKKLVIDNRYSWY